MAFALRRPSLVVILSQHVKLCGALVREQRSCFDHKCTSLSVIKTVLFYGCEVKGTESLDTSDHVKYSHAQHNDVSVVTDRIYDGGPIRLYYNIMYYIL